MNELAQKKVAYMQNGAIIVQGKKECAFSDKDKGDEGSTCFGF